MTLARCEEVYGKLRGLFSGVQEALLVLAISGKGSGARRGGRRKHSDALEEMIPAVPVGDLSELDNEGPEFLQRELF